MRSRTLHSDDAESADYKTVRGLTRGLLLLNTLNRLDGGASVGRLAELTGIHRTTVRRMLETLRDEGYVRRSESDDSFRLSIKVRELSEGFRDEQWISEIAAPMLAELMQEVVWPTDLCTFDADAMVVRETTHRFSRLSVHRSMVGRRLPMLLTATGTAYLAFCPDAEREQIIELLAGREGESFALARDRRRLDTVLGRVRLKGHGENNMSWNREERISAIAVPIRGDGRLLGCLNVVCSARILPIQRVAERFFAPLRATALRIEEALAVSRAAMESSGDADLDLDEVRPEADPGP